MMKTKEPILDHSPEISQLEIDARKMLNTYRDNHPFSPYTQVIMYTFKLMWSNSLDIKHIVKISEAVNNIHNLDVSEMQKHLTKMLRNKLLRSRVMHGIRYYELNFGE